MGLEPQSLEVDNSSDRDTRSTSSSQESTREEQKSSENNTIHDSSRESLPATIKEALSSTIDIPNSSRPSTSSANSSPVYPDVCPGYMVFPNNLHVVDPDWSPSCKEEAEHYLRKSNQDTPIPQDNV